MIVTQAINVHLDKRSNPTVETVQSDTGRAIKAALFNQGLAWQPPEGATGTVRHSMMHEGEMYTSAYDTLSDGSPAVSFSGNEMTVCLSPEVLSIPGVGELQVGILQADELVATLSILLRVQRNVGTQGLTPTAYTDLSHHIQNELTRKFRDIRDQGGWLEQLHSRVATVFTPGGLTQDGTVDPTMDHLICSDLIFNAGRQVHVVLPAGIKVRCRYYDKELVCQQQTGFFESSFRFYSTEPYLRLEMAYQDDGRIQDPQGLAEQVGVFYSGPFRGHIGALGYNGFYKCTDSGYFRFTAEDLPALEDAPDIRTGGILEVMPHADDGVIFQTLRTSDGEVWFRWGTNPFEQINRPKAFLVTYTDNEDEFQRIDKSFEEIRAAIDAGMVVQCMTDGVDVLPLVRDFRGSVVFGRVFDSMECSVSIWADGQARLTRTDTYLPYATADTLGGVMPVAKTKAMTQSVGVDEDGKLWTYDYGSTSIFHYYDGYFAENFIDIQAAFDDGDVCICDFEGVMLPLSRYVQGLFFDFRGVLHGKEYSIRVNSDDTVNFSVNEIASGVFTVTYTQNDDPFQCIDTTWDEICEAVENGMLVECVANDARCRLAYGSRSDGYFTFIDFIDQTLIRVTISRASGASIEYIEGMTSVRWVRVSENNDGSACIDQSNMTNRDFHQIDNGVSLEALPYMIFLPRNDIDHVFLPYVGQTVRWDDASDTYYGVHIFSRVIPPVEGQEKPRRYTVKLLVEYGDSEPVDPDGYPLIEYSVEELDRENTDGSYSLPIAASDTLGGVQPVAKTEDMTQPVGVDEIGRLWIEPAGGNGDSSPGDNAGAWSKTTVTLEQDVQQISLTFPDAKRVFVKTCLNANDSESSLTTGSVRADMVLNDRKVHYITVFLRQTTKYYTYLEAEIIADLLKIYRMETADNNIAYSAKNALYVGGLNASVSGDESLNSLVLSFYDRSDLFFMAGGTVEVWYQ